MATDAATLVREFGVGISVVEEILPDYNIAPSKAACIVRRDEAGVRILEVATWGLIPSWSKDAAIAHRLVNARSETAAEKPSFRSALSKRRCIVPAQGYYEWYRPARQPFYLHAADGHLLAMAGLYEWWRDPADPDAPPRQTFTILTREPAPEIARIHDRMPVLLPPARWDTWPDPATPADEVADMMTPEGPVQGAVGSVDAYPVSTAVNAVRNNGPALIEPVMADVTGPSGVAGSDSDASEGLW